MNLNERINQLMAENERLKLTIAESRSHELIHIGFTNERQVHYVTTEKLDGSFYPDSENECYIPVYMLATHAHRAGSDSPIYCKHIKLHDENKQLKAERDALAAQVGAFAAMIIEARIADESKDFLGSDWHERSDGLMVSIPEQHLAAHDAEVGAKAVLEFAAKLLVNQKVDVIDCAKVESDQLRAKAGA